jgi:DNA-binding LacI/PurR family transcriptional regulator
MLNKRELNKIKKLLPKGGYQVIADNLGISKDTVTKAFNQKDRYRGDVVETAYQVIKAYNQKARSLKDKFKKLAS